MCENSRACSFRNMILSKNESLTYVDLSDYYKLVGESLEQREAFMRKKRENRIKILSNLKLLAKVEEIGKKASLTDIVGGAIKRKAPRGLVEFPSNKRILKTFVVRKRVKNQPPSKSTGKTSPALAEKELGLIYKFSLIRNGKKVIKTIKVNSVQIRSKKNTSSNRDFTGRRRRRNFLTFYPITLWDFIKMRLPSNKFADLTSTEGMSQVRASESKATVGRNDQIVEKGEERESQVSEGLEINQDQSEVDSKPASWLAELKRNYACLRRKRNSVNRRRACKKKGVPPLAETGSSQGGLTFKRANMLLAKEQHVQVCSIRQRSVCKERIDYTTQTATLFIPTLHASALLEREIRQSISIEGEREREVPAVSVSGTCVPNDSFVYDSQELISTSYSFTQNLQTNVQDNPPSAQRTANGLFVHNLFRQDHCLLCADHGKPYKWSSFKKQKYGNVKDYFPEIMWRTELGNLVINLLAEMVDQVLVFPIVVLRDLFFHFLFRKNFVQHAFFTKFLSFIMRRELQVLEMESHKSTSFYPLCRSLVQWFLIVPKYVTKLCSYNTQESSVIVKTLFVGWFGLFLFFTFLFYILRKLIPSFLIKLFFDFLEFMAEKKKQEQLDIKPIWDGEFVKELLSPCEHRGFVLNSVCKLDKIQRFLNVISAKGRSQVLNLDTILGEGGMGLYHTFTWWSFFGSSLVCIQAIARLISDFKVTRIEQDDSLFSSFLMLLKLVAYTSFLVFNTLMVSRFLQKNVLELGFMLFVVATALILSSRFLSHVFSCGCGWTNSFIKVDKKDGIVNRGALRDKKENQNLSRFDGSKVIFSSKEIPFRRHKMIKVTQLVSFAKALSELVLVGCAFTWLLSSISSPYKFYLQRKELRLFFGSGGKKFFHLNIASIIVTLLGFSENFSVIISPLFLLAYLMYEYRGDILIYFGEELSSMFKNGVQMSTITLNCPALSRFYNIEFLSLFFLLAVEYLLAFLQLSASRIMGKFHVATFRFLNIYLAYMILLCAKKVVGNYIGIISSSGIIWLILALLARTSMGSSMMIKTTKSTEQVNENFLEVAKTWPVSHPTKISVPETKQEGSDFLKFLVRICRAVIEKVSTVSISIGVKVLDLGKRETTGGANFKKGVQQQFDLSKLNILRLRKMCPRLGEVSHNDMFAFEVGNSIISASHVIKDKVIYDTSPDEVFKVVSQSGSVKDFLQSVAKPESFRDTYTDQVSFGAMPTYVEPPNGMPVFTPTPDGDVKLGIVKDCITTAINNDGISIKTLGNKRIFYPHVKQGMSGLPILSPMGVVGGCGTHEVVPTTLFPSVMESVPGIKEFSGLCRIPIQDVKASELMNKACQTHMHSRFDLVAQTGSGKSTIFPIKLSLTNGGAKVILVTPRVSAAINAYNRIILLIEEAGLDLNCSLISGPRKEGTLNSDILIFTVGSFLFLLGFGGIDLSGSDIILDEVHVHEGPMMCLLEVLQKRLENKQLGRFFTATATPVGCTIADLNPNGDNFPIEMVQVDCDSTIDNHLISNLSNVCKSIIKHSGKVNMIFLPTISSLSMVEAKLIELNAEVMRSKTGSHTIKVFKVHSLNMVSQLPLIRKRIHDLRTACAMAKKIGGPPLSVDNLNLVGEKIFLLTTNCLETGVTLDLDTVFCSGLVVSERYDGVASINLHKRAISTQEFIQQRGRVGRTKPGKCVYFVSKKSPFLNKLSYLPGDMDTAYCWLSLLGHGEEIHQRNLLAKEISSKDYYWHKNVLLSPFRPIVALYNTTKDGKFRELALDILKMSKSPGEVLVSNPEDELDVPIQQVVVNLSRFSPHDVNVFLQVLGKFGVPIEGKVDKKSSICVTYASKFLMSSLHVLQLALIAKKVEQDVSLAGGKKEKEKVKKSSPVKGRTKLVHGGVNGNQETKNIHTLIRTSVEDENQQIENICISSSRIVVVVDRIPLERFLLVEGGMKEFLSDIFGIKTFTRDSDFEFNAVETAEIDNVDTFGGFQERHKEFEEVLIERLRKYDKEQVDFRSTENIMLKVEKIKVDDHTGPLDHSCIDSRTNKVDFLDALKQRYSYPSRNMKTSREYVKDWLDQLQFSHIGFLVMLFTLIVGIVSLTFFKSFLELYNFLKLWHGLSDILGMNIGMYVRVLVAFWYSTYFQKTSTYISKQKNKVLARMSDCLDSIKVVRRTSPVLAVLSHVAVHKLAKKEGKKVALKWRERIEPQLRLAGGGLNLKLMSRDCETIIENTGVQESIDKTLFSTAFDPKLLVLVLIFSPVTALFAFNLCLVLKLFVFGKTPTPIVWILYAFPLASSMASLLQGNFFACLLFILSIFTSHISGVIGNFGTSFIRGLCLVTSASNVAEYQTQEIELTQQDSLELYSREVLNNDAHCQTPFGLLSAEPLDTCQNSLYKYIDFECVKRRYNEPSLPHIPVVHDLNLFKHGEKRQGIVAAYLLENCESWFPDKVIDVTAGRDAEFCASILRRRPDINVQAMTIEQRISLGGSGVPVRQLRPDYNIERKGIPGPLVKGALYVVSYSRHYPPNLQFVSSYSEQFSQLVEALRRQKCSILDSEIKILIKVDEFLCKQDLEALVSFSVGSYPSACLDPLKPFELPTIWLHLDFSRKTSLPYDRYLNWFMGISTLQCNRARFQGGEISVSQKRKTILRFIRTRDLTFNKDLCHDSQELSRRQPDPRCEHLLSLHELGIEVPKGKVFSTSISSLKQLGYVVTVPKPGEKYCGFEVVAHCKGMKRGGSNGIHAPSGFRDWLEEETLIPVNDFEIDFADEWDRAVEKAIMTRMNKKCPATMRFYDELKETFSQFTMFILQKLAGRRIGPLSWPETLSQVNRSSTMGKIDKLTLGHRKVGDFVDDPAAQALVRKCVENYSKESAPLNTLYYLFPKDEKRFFEPRHIVDGVKVPRLISMHGGVMRVTETMLFSQLSEVLYGGERITVNNFPLFTNGLSKPQVARLVVHLCSKYENNATEDFSAWDASITPALQILEYEFWDAICSEELKVPLKNYFLQDMFKLCCGPGGEIFRVYGQRASGAWNTSAGNGLINLIVQLTRLRSALGGISLREMFSQAKCHVLVEGDDSVVFSDRKTLEKFFKEDVIAVDAGFSVKRGPEPIRSRPEDVTYLSHGYTKVVGVGGNTDSFWPVRKLDIIVQRLSFLRRYNPRKHKQNKINEVNMLFSALIDYFPIVGLRNAIISRLAQLQLAKDHFVEFGKRYDGFNVKRFLPHELPKILSEIHNSEFASLELLELSDVAKSVVDGELVVDIDFSILTPIKFLEIIQTQGTESKIQNIDSNGASGIGECHAPISRKTFLNIRTLHRTYAKSVTSDVNTRRVLAAKYLLSNPRWISPRHGEEFKKIIMSEGHGDLFIKEEENPLWVLIINAI
jgi:hypothetical protein